MSPDLLYLACAIIAVIISGLAKGGFAGVGALAMPIMALGVDPVRGAAILLPILILQDAVSVWAFRRSWDGHILAVMLPGMAIGVGLGYWFAAQVSETAVLGALGWGRPLRLGRREDAAQLGCVVQVREDGLDQRGVGGSVVLLGDRPHRSDVESVGECPGTLGGRHDVRRECPDV